MVEMGVNSIQHDVRMPCSPGHDNTKHQPIANIHECKLKPPRMGRSGALVLMQAPTWLINSRHKNDMIIFNKSTNSCGLHVLCNSHKLQICGVTTNNTSAEVIMSMPQHRMSPPKRDDVHQRKGQQSPKKRTCGG